MRESQDAAYAKAITAFKAKELQRTSKRLMRVRLLCPRLGDGCGDARGSGARGTAVLTWWSPNEGVIEALHEGATIHLKHVNVAKKRVRDLSLSNARNTVLQPIPISDEMRRAAGFTPRECATFAEAEKSISDNPWKEFDLVGVVVRSCNERGAPDGAAQLFVDFADAQDEPLVRLEAPLRTVTAVQSNEPQDARFGRIFSAQPGDVWCMQNAQLFRACTRGPLTLRVTDELVVFPAKAATDSRQYLGERIRQLQNWASQKFATLATRQVPRIFRVVELTQAKGECFVRMTSVAKEEDVRVRVPTELHEALLRSALHSMSNGAVAQEQIQRGETLELLSQISKRMTSAMLRCTFTTSMVLADVAPADASMVLSEAVL